MPVPMFCCIPTAFPLCGMGKCASVLLSAAARGTRQPMVGSAPHRLRLTITQVRTPGMADGVQLGGLRFLDAGEVPLRIASISNPGGTSPRFKGADQLLDPSSRGKWFDSNFTTAAHSVLLITLLANDPFPAQFELITANDASKRDPSAWQVPASLAFVARCACSEARCDCSASCFDCSAICCCNRASSSGRRPARLAGWTA